MGGTAGVLAWATSREPGPPTASGSCAAPSGTLQQDVDPDDTPEAPWPRTPGEPVVVTFTTGQLPPRYARLVEEAAQIWSRGPCVQAVTAAGCPDEGNCSTGGTRAGRSVRWRESECAPPHRRRTTLELELLGDGEIAR